jgi:hypothetical protein
MSAAVCAPAMVVDTTARVTAATASSAFSGEASLTPEDAGSVRGKGFQSGSFRLCSLICSSGESDPH